ncbi:tetratricopeptide repeat protein [Novosphingobium sp. Leaf2]|uniref:tetratricopeptide repeat protein n=1 Tax=Novosphingobium sp. Leaf2 TaxID=1735670 RepID=UPI0006F1CFAA|nr:tetratricopeptide repeat protein [Novosphingobium sp. Leaf2]KQM19484.1 cytochrome C biosynthesis protein [Novosphingobium sp. Leaf2]
MGWIPVVLLVIAVLTVLLFVLKVPRGAREAVASTLLLGLAGYAAQGSPRMAGAPKDTVEPVADNPAAMVDARSKFSKSGIPPTNHWVVIADGLARNGEYADAAEILRGAVQADPGNSEAWLAMANALVAHADGTLTPASLYAYRRAAQSDADAPGPPFFLGLAYARQGDLAQARKLWLELVLRAPEDAPWRLPLAQQLMQLDAVLAAQKAQASPDQR